MNVHGIFWKDNFYATNRGYIIPIYVSSACLSSAIPNKILSIRVIYL